MLGSHSPRWVWTSFSLNRHSAILLPPFILKPCLYLSFCDTALSCLSPTLLAMGVPHAGSVSSAWSSNAVSPQGLFLDTLIFLTLYFLPIIMNNKSTWYQLSSNWTLDSQKVIFSPHLSLISKYAYLTAHSTFYLEIWKATQNLQIQNWFHDLFPQGFLSWFHHQTTHPILQVRSPYIILNTILFFNTLIYH